MKINEEYLKKLVDRQTESLNVEFKRWIDPKSPEGISKIIKASIAMRNNNGGFFFIGFDEESRQPDLDNAPIQDVRDLYNLDDIQSIISKYAYPQFEIDIRFVEKGGQDYPAICISEGIRTPVSTKSELRNANDKLLIKQNTVYVRTLKSNGTPSTSEATYQDWDKLINICFDNREADIGRFVRRHLSNVDKAVLQSLFNNIIEISQTRSASYDELSIDLLDRGKKRFEVMVKEKYPNQQLPKHGTWEVTCVVNSHDQKYSANRTFLNLLSSSNPNYTGWPIWLDSRDFTNPAARPYVFENAWEACMVSLNSDWSNHVDFWRIDPLGQFYLYRALEDDIKPSIPPLELLDFGLPIWRVGESLAVGLAFTQAMSYEIETTNLTFSFRWTQLQDRTLTSWANHMRSIRERRATQNIVLSSVNLPLTTPLSALYQYVDMATKPLYQIFDGFELSTNIVEELTQKMLGRKE
ncbi:helix-turn-helix domain-containing protein [Sporomusa aerivorans]|uniref:AlbA family DNA-binding domain-containing protein n=1 Tax=Sporomusa aerivorans TaxID=204936 RepID=UPI00352B8F5C